MSKNKKRNFPLCLAAAFLSLSPLALADCVLEIGFVAGGGNRITCDSSDPNPFQEVSNVVNGRTSNMADEVILQADTIIAPDSDERTFFMSGGNDDLTGSGAVIFGSGQEAIDMDEGINSINLVDSALFGGEGVENLVENGTEGSTFYFEGVLFDSLDWGTAGIFGSLGVDDFELVNSRMIVETQAIGTSLNGDLVTVTQSTIENRGTLAIGVSTGSDSVTITNSIVVSRNKVLDGGRGADSFIINNSRLESQERSEPFNSVIQAGLGADNIEIGNCSEILGDITAGENDDVVALGNLATFEGTVSGDNEQLENPSPDSDVLRFEQQLAAGPACDQLVNDIGNLPTPNGSFAIDGITYNYQGFESIESNITCSTAVSCADAPAKGAGDLLFDDLDPVRATDVIEVPVAGWAFILGLLATILLFVRQRHFKSV